MVKNVVHTSDAPEAIGPYSQAVITEDQFVFTAGQIPIDPETGQIVQGDIEIQTKRVILNIEAVLKAAGSSLEDVIKTTVFLKDMDHFTEMNKVYATFFNVQPPARSAVEVSRLPKDVLIEVECVAKVQTSPRD